MFVDSGGKSKQEEACDLYFKAANAFKMAKRWPRKYDMPHIIM